MKISILLPYKENFSPHNAGAVSIFINETVKISKYKKNIVVYGNTEKKERFKTNYVNLNFNKSFLKSSSKSYILEFLKKETKNKSDIIEFHNRPSYLKYLLKLENTKKVLYFHNDPLEMSGSKTIKDRIFLLNKLSKIIFNSDWSKSRFIKNLNHVYKSSPKLIVIKQSINSKKINLRNKKKNVIFVGKLNKAKGYDIFGEAILPILNKYKNWSGIVIGDEPREKIFFNHKRLKILASPKNTLSMRDNWERAISVAEGDWVSIIGDDDILSPELVFFLRSLITNHGFENFECIKWRTINFSWKGVNVDGRRNTATIPIEGDKVRKFKCDLYLDNILKWNLPERTMGCGPSIYHGAWKRSLINKVKEMNNGVVFDAETVDYDAGYNALLLTEQFIILERPSGPYRSIVFISPFLQKNNPIFFTGSTKIKL